MAQQSLDGRGLAAVLFVGGPLLFGGVFAVDNGLGGLVPDRRVFVAANRRDAILLVDCSPRRERRAVASLDVPGGDQGFVGVAVLVLRLLLRS